MQVQGDPGRNTTIDGGKITDLVGGEILETIIQPQDNSVKIAGVMVSEGGASPVSITASALNTYLHTMNAIDTDIWVFLGDYHIATAVKDDPAGLPGNQILNIANLTNPALPNSSPLWTLAEKADEIQVQAATEPGYFATVTADIVKADGSRVAIAPDRIYQDVNTGTITIRLLDKMPDDNVEVTVHFTDKEPEPVESKVTLIVEGHDNETDNWATAVAKDGSVTLLANSASAPIQYQDENDAVPNGVVFDLTTNAVYVDPANYYYVESITIKVDGTLVNTTQDNPTEFTVPFSPAPSETVVTVKLAKGPRTARPYDGNQDPSSATAHPEFIDGYLLAKNLGSNQVEITVPNLYETATKAVIDAKDVEYKLYVKVGAAYQLLVEGTDYSVVSGPTPYTHGAGNGEKSEAAESAGRVFPNRWCHLYHCHRFYYAQAGE